MFTVGEYWILVSTWKKKHWKQAFFNTSMSVLLLITRRFVVHICIIVKQSRGNILKSELNFPLNLSTSIFFAIPKKNSKVLKNIKSRIQIRFLRQILPYNWEIVFILHHMRRDKGCVLQYGRLSRKWVF